MRVTLDVFSGRENPFWDLSPEKESELFARLASLKVSPSGRRPPDVLGYRGFIVTALTGDLCEYEEIRVFPKRVIALRGGRTLYFSDPDRTLERWLLASSRDYIEADLLKELSAQVGPE